MDIEPVVRQHLGALKIGNNRQLTIYARERVLTRLTRWAQGPILYLTEDRLVAYQTWRASGDDDRDPIGPTSMRVEVSHIRCFYRWTREEHLRDDDPTVRLIVPKRVDYEARPLADDLLQRALDTADAHMRAVLALARYAGLRACEIARLDWREVHLASKPAQLTVREGKGGYIRKVHLAAVLVDILRELPNRNGPVIPRINGEPGFNTASRISQRAGEFLREKGAEPGQTLHALRHSFGTATYRATRDIVSVQEEMGHRTIATTRIYTKGDSQARAEMVEAGSKIHLDEAS